MANLGYVFNSSGIDRLLSESKTLSQSYTKVGILGESNSEIAEYAIYNEFGTLDGKIPSRPFFRTTKSEHKKPMLALSGKLIGMVFEQKITPQQGLSILGEKFTNELQKTVIAWKNPPNAESTIARKGDDNPLVDKGRLVQSFTHIEVMK